ncbi:hypothetical protein M0638_27950 [Roseomonas sp. NAR14]|uniref:PLD phosphodiesterase domain-containing protein n=1 Tax=Roseomonas acroporae TaxID=2937791 RepID=A0A9X2BX01_9PROT|nr:hypothetical protein [Roseomonas acroporae]MCK8788187.1 hypothetical protein [Roseomonas acroporae]
MTPFLNEEGMRWALRVFAEAPPGVERHLVLRNRQRVYGLLHAHHDEFRALGVSLFDYWVPSPSGSGYETFHAKVVLADAEFAYLGSANFIRYLCSSVEMGVLLEGLPVLAVAETVAAAKEISEKFSV